MLKAVVAEEVATILRLPGEGIDPLRPLSEMGMVLSMAVELRLALENRLRVDLPLVSLTEGTSVASIAMRLTAAVSTSPRDGEVIALAAHHEVAEGARSSAEPRQSCGGVVIGSEPPPVWSVSAGKGAAHREAIRGILRTFCGALASPLWPGRGRIVAPRLDVSELDGFREIRMIREAADFLGIADPFFREHEGIASAETLIGNKPYVNFASYNYIGLTATHISRTQRRLRSTATELQFGQPSGSGERPIHRELEQALARIHGCEDCVVLVGGHSKNVTLIGHLLDRNDVIVHDALIHNSIVQGACFPVHAGCRFRISITKPRIDCWGSCAHVMGAHFLSSRGITAWMVMSLTYRALSP